jgi:hypothetical protein
MSRNRKGQTTKRGSIWYQECFRKKGFILFKEFNALWEQLKTAKAENRKKRKAESLLSTEINLTNSSDKMEKYFLFPPIISRPSIKLVENSHSTTKLVVSFNVYHEEHVLRVLADTGDSSSIILEAYPPRILSSTMEYNGWFVYNRKTELVTFLLPKFNIKKQITWEFHVDDRSKPWDTYGVIIGRDLLLN